MLKITKSKQRDLWMVDARKIGGKRKGFKDKITAGMHAKKMWLDHQTGNYIISDQQVTGQEAIYKWIANVEKEFDNEEYGLSEKGDKIRSANRLNNQKIFGKRFKNWNLNELISGERTPYAISEQIKNGDITINHHKCNPKDCMNHNHGSVSSAIDTRNHYLVHFKQFFNYCVALGYMNKNPLLGTKIKERKNKKDKKATRIAPSNMTKVFNNMDKKFQIVMEFAIQTGLRQGEQRALMWKHIDFDKELLIIEQAVQMYSIGSVKTMASFRKIPLNSELITKLKSIKIQRKSARDNDYVFTLRRGSRISHKSFTKYLYDAIDKAGLERFKWHDLRHYFASGLFASFKEDYDRVTNLLGHTDMSFTRKTYVHWFNNEKENKEIKEAISANLSL